MANIRTVRRSGRVFRGGRMRRETLWTGITETETAMAAASTAVLFTGFGASTLALRPFTIVRVRGWWHLRSDQLAGTESYMAGIGMAVVSDQALAIGVTAVPTPFTDKASDLWFLHDIMSGQFAVSSAIGILEVGRGKELESRAMRKVEEGQDVALSIETASTSNGAVIAKAGRILIKLH